MFVGLPLVGYSRRCRRLARLLPSRPLPGRFMRSWASYIDGGAQVRYLVAPAPLHVPLRALWSWLHRYSPKRGY